MTISAQDVTEARTIAEATLDATCTIRRIDPDATATVDTSTGAVTRGTPTTLYTGACSVTAEGTGGSEGHTGSRDLPGQAWSLKLPASATGLRSGDLATITAVADTGLSDLVGVPLTVDLVDVRSRAILRHVRVLDLRPRAVDLP